MIQKQTSCMSPSIYRSSEYRWLTCSKSKEYISESDDDNDDGPPAASAPQTDTAGTSALSDAGDGSGAVSDSGHGNGMEVDDA